MRLLAGYLLGFAFLTQSGCAHIQSFSDHAERVRDEAAALYLAADELDQECAQLQEPRPKVCEAAARLMEAVRPYVPGPVSE